MKVSELVRELMKFQGIMDREVIVEVRRDDYDEELTVEAVGSDAFAIFLELGDSKEQEVRYAMRLAEANRAEARRVWEEETRIKEEAQRLGLEGMLP